MKTHLMRGRVASTAPIRHFGAFLLACSLLFIWQGSATAAVTHSFDSSFSVGLLDEPTSVAVDEASGDVLVLDVEGNLGRFDEDGDPTDFSALDTNVIPLLCGSRCNQVAVDNSDGPNAGTVYVSSTASGFFENGGVEVLLPSGVLADRIVNSNSEGGETSHCGVTTDSAGHVYVGHADGAGRFDGETGQLNDPKPSTRAFINRFDPGAWVPADDPVTQVWPVAGTLFALPRQVMPFTLNGCSIASDSLGNQYFTGFEPQDKLKPHLVVRVGAAYDYIPATDAAAELIDSASTYFYVDLSNDDLYSNHQDEIARFDSAGHLQEVFGSGDVENSFGVAIDGETGTVYATNKDLKTVSVFAAIQTPDASASAKAEATTAVLSGHLDPAGAGDVTGCSFEYGTTAAYGQVAACSPDPSGEPFNAETNVSAALSGLTKEATYHYRMLATNANGTTATVDQTFSTHNISGLGTDAPTEVTQTTATLNGSFTSNGEPTTYYFEWGPTVSYGSQTGDKEATGSPSQPVAASAPIAGLQTRGPLSTPYHYRIVATNGLGTTYGPDRSFYSAPPNPPQVLQASAAATSPSEATLSAQINPSNAESYYLFEYGIDSSYGALSDVAEVGSDGGDHLVASDLGDLSPGTTYHYRVVAFNFGGSSHGPDQTFTTPDKPDIEFASALSATQTTARLNALVFANASPTVVTFEYGLSGDYGLSTGSVSIGSELDGHQAVIEISGLNPGTTYHFRAAASNAIGATVGTDQTFTTSPLAPESEQGDRPKKCKKGRVRKKGKCMKQVGDRKRKGARNRGGRGR